MGTRRCPVSRYNREALFEPEVEYTRDDYQMGGAGKVEVP